MSIHISIQARPDCYAILWSYGEICCHSNCCGQFGKGLKMWEARLKYHEYRVNELKEKEKKMQKYNPNADYIILCEQKLINKCKKWIKYYKERSNK